MAILLTTARVDVADVKDIIETSLTDSEINAFINSANRLVNATVALTGIDSSILTEIEQWLSAHFLAIRDQRVEREKVGGEWEATYQGKTEKGLSSTTYGQQAIILDYTGTLASLGQKAATIQVWSEYDDDDD